MEYNRNHQITLNKGVLEFSSLNTSDYGRPNYQIKDSVQMVIAILTENDQYDESFLLHSTNPCQPKMHGKKRILNANEETIFQANTHPSLIVVHPTKNE